eukprot:scaffold211903_cov39-Prasinocladus_malaysianus.AAC.1
MPFNNYRAAIPKSSLFQRFISRKAARSFCVIYLLSIALVCCPGESYPVEDMSDGNLYLLSSMQHALIVVPLSGDVRSSMVHFLDL